MRYPRPGEPIVPRLLRPFVLERHPDVFTSDPDAGLIGRSDLGPGAWKRLTEQTCKRISLLVVDRVQTRLRLLPDAIRDVPLPEPRVALELPLELRTRNALRRAVGSQIDGEAWTVGRYLAIRRFGGRALVDLMAALEAHEDASRASATTMALEADLALQRSLLQIARQVPIAEHQLDVGDARGRAVRALDVTGMLRSAAQFGHELSVCVVMIGGTRVVVRRSDLTAARGSYRIAVRTVRTMGIASLDGIASQVNTTTRSTIDGRFVEGVLSGLSTFHWLDKDGGWFWFEQPSNPLLANVRKVLSVASRLPLARLATVLFRSWPGPRPSPAVVRSLCRAVPEARVADRTVAVDVPLDRNAHLNEKESHLVRFLEAAGRGLSDVQLRWLVREIGMAWTPIWQLLRSSPLFERSPEGLFRLVGSS